jgi:hypothetical protein
MPMCSLPNVVSIEIALTFFSWISDFGVQQVDHIDPTLGCPDF